MAECILPGVDGAGKLRLLVPLARKFQLALLATAQRVVEATLSLRPPRRQARHLGGRALLGDRDKGQVG